MDACARGLLIAAKIIEDGKLGKIVSDRYGKWSEPKNQAMLKGKETLESIAARVHAEASSRNRSRHAGTAGESDQQLYVA